MAAFNDQFTLPSGRVIVRGDTIGGTPEEAIYWRDGQILNGFLVGFRLSVADPQFIAPGTVDKWLAEGPDGFHSRTVLGPGERWSATPDPAWEDAEVAEDDRRATRELAERESRGETL